MSDSQKPQYPVENTDLALREAVSEIVSTYNTWEGVQSWWRRERYQLGGKTPNEVVTEDPLRIVRLAIAGRSQGAS